MKKDIKTIMFRGVRKSAHLTRRSLYKGARFSEKVENKAHRIINGIDSTININDHIKFEKYYYESLPYITPLYPALPTADRKGMVTLLIPSLQKSSFFGGTATAIIFACELASKMGLNIRIVETLKHGEADKGDIVDFVKNNDYKFNNSNVVLIDVSARRFNIYGYIDIHPNDIFLVSAWWDAYIADRLPLPNKYIYLIQDYEPIFYSNSDKFVLADSTYKSDKFLPVCNTELMYKFMASKNFKYIKDCGLWFEPAVNIGSKYGYIDKNKIGKKRVFIYGRPSVERNLFYIALKSIDYLFSEGLANPKDYEIFMAGQDKISDIQLPCGITIINLGKMAITDYYKFVPTVDIALSLMLAPHPNYPTLEFASCGVQVITTIYETKTNLSIYSENIHIVEPDFIKIASTIVKLSDFNRSVAIDNAMQCNIPNNWNDALNNVISSIALYYKNN